MKAVTLTDDEIKLLIDLIQDERKYASVLRLESEHVLEHVDCGNISAGVQKKQIKEAEETITKCNELLKKLGVEE